ncbi:F-box/FBD/LRR-repeat protein At1g16930 [Linum grandiflorum]
MKRKRGGIIHTAAPGDRLSNLPDEVIHDILARLKSSKQPARLAILSKRWNRLWRSYPAIDFNYNEYERPITVRSLHPFLTAAAKKFSNLRHPSAVRIQLYGHGQLALLDKLLGFVAKDTPEVRLNRSCNCDCDYIAIGPTLFKGDRFRGLKVVKLQSIHFPSGSSVSFGAALQVLSLKLVRFPDKNNDGEGDRILNSMIGSASCLETLTLKHIRGIGKFRIRNCLNLKTLKAGEFRADSFEISGAESLETLHVCYTGSEERFQVSLSPNNNVKVVHIGDTGIATNEEVNKFISKFSRLELLKLNDVPLVPRLKINVGNHKFLRSIWIDYTGPIAGPKVIEIDGPLRLSKLVLNMKGGSGSPDILINQAVQVSVRWRLSYQIHWHEFKQFLANLISRFRLTTLEFVHVQRRLMYSIIRRRLSL